MKIKMKKYGFLLVLGLLVSSSIQNSIAATTSASTPKGVSVDPAAVALLGRAVKLYSNCKTLRLRWRWIEKSPLSEHYGVNRNGTIAFVRPDYSSIEIKGDWYQHYIVDSQYSWSLSRQGKNGKISYTRNSLPKGKNALGEALSSFSFATEVGGAIGAWLKGQHQLQTAQLKDFRILGIGLEYYEAKKLAAIKWKGRSCERVRIRYRYGPKSEISGYYSDITFWLASDNSRLVKVEEFGEGTEKTHEILEQTFDAPIPASTFVFKIPKGAKKE